MRQRLFIQLVRLVNWLYKELVKIQPAYKEDPKLQHYFGILREIAPEAFN